MKKNYTFLAILAMLALTSGLLKAAPGPISTHPVDPAITTSGIVRVVFTVPLDTINGGVVFVQDSMYHTDIVNVNTQERFNWNGMGGIVRTNNGDANHYGNDTIDFYDGTDEDDGRGTYSNGLAPKTWETGDTICAWFTINVPAHTQTVHLQKSDEPNSVTLCLQNAGTRNKSFTEINAIQSVGNLVDGVPLGPTVISVDVVSSVEPYWPLANSLENNSVKNLKVYPTLVSDVLNVSAESAIKHIEIFSITGSPVLNSNANTVDVSSLVGGTYIVSVTDQTGAKSFTRIIKK